MRSFLNFHHQPNAARTSTTSSWTRSMIASTDHEVFEQLDDELMLMGGMISLLAHSCSNDERRVGVIRIYEKYVRREWQL